MNYEELVLKVLYEKPNKPENVVKSKHVKFEELKIACFGDDNVPDSKLLDYESIVEPLLDDLRNLENKGLIKNNWLGENVIEPLSTFITERGIKYYTDMFLEESYDE